KPIVAGLCPAAAAIGAGNAEIDRPAGARAMGLDAGLDEGRLPSDYFRIEAMAAILAHQVIEGDAKDPVAFFRRIAEIAPVHDHQTVVGIEYAETIGDRIQGLAHQAVPAAQSMQFADVAQADDMAAGAVGARARLQDAA